MAAALAAVLGTVLFTMAVPVGAGVAPASGAGPDAAAMSAPVTLRHARQCASVQRSSARTMVVPVVVDTGGPSATAEVACVSVPVGSNGAQVLTARAKLLHVPAPRYAESGLLCAIDGYPATGCGVQNGPYYAYWAYYHGGSSWTYASVGPAEWKVSPGDVEGWRFQPQGTATPADPPPRAPSEASTLCPSSTTTTTAPSPPTTIPTTTVTTAPGQAGSPPGPAPPGPVTGSRSPPAPSPSRSAAGEARPASTSATTVPSTTATTPPSSTLPPGDVIELGRSGKRTVGRLALAHSGPAHGGGSVWIYIALAVIMALAIGAVLRTRSTKAA